MALHHILHGTETQYCNHNLCSKTTRPYLVKLLEFSEYQHLRLRDSSVLIPPGAYQNVHVSGFSLPKEY